MFDDDKEKNMLDDLNLGDDKEEIQEEVDRMEQKAFDDNEINVDSDSVTVQPVQFA